MNAIKFLTIIFAAFSLLFFACSKEDKKPWDLYVPDTGPGGDDSGSSELHLYKLYSTPLPAGRVSGGMVLVPAYDDTFTVSGDTNLYHRASGFIDLNDDTAFVTDSFWMDTSEVTKAQWLAVMADTTDKTPADWPRTDVSWFNAIRYCVRKSVAEGLTPCYDTTGWRPDSINYILPRIVDANGYRLPTEDEWEYAARGGVRNFSYATDNGTLSKLKACYLDSALIDTSAIAVTRYRGPYIVRYFWGKFEYQRAASLTVDSITAMTSRAQATDSAYYVRTKGDTLAPSLLFEYSFICSTNVNNIIESYKVAFRDTVAVAPRDSENLSEEVWYGYFDTTLLLYTYAPDKVVPGQDTAFDTLAIRWKWSREYLNYTTRTFYPYTNTDKNRRTLVRDEPRDSINLKKGNTIFGFMDSLVKTTTRVEDSLLSRDSMKYFDNDYSIRKNTTTYFHLKGSYRLPAVRSVATYPANPFGLHDLTGNAEEWCFDAFRDFRRSYRVDFTDTLVTPFRSLRGGSCTSGSFWGVGSELYLNNGFRRGKSPTTPYNLFGLRTVRRAR